MESQNINNSSQEKQSRAAGEKEEKVSESSVSYLPPPLQLSSSGGSSAMATDHAQKPFQLTEEPLSRVGSGVISKEKVNAFQAGKDYPKKPLGYFLKDEKIEIFNRNNGALIYVKGSIHYVEGGQAYQGCYLHKVHFINQEKIENAKEIVGLIQNGKWKKAVRQLLEQDNSFTKNVIGKIRDKDSLKQLWKAAKKQRSHANAGKLINTLRGKMTDLIKEKSLMAMIAAKGEEVSTDSGGEANTYWDRVAESVLEVAEISKRRYLKVILHYLEKSSAKNPSKEDKTKLLKKIHAALDRVYEKKKRKLTKQKKDKALKKWKKYYDRAVRVVEERITYFEGLGNANSGTSPEKTMINATGKYFSKGGIVGGGHFKQLASLQINQAGHYVKGHLQYQTKNPRGIAVKKHEIEGLVMEDNKEELVIEYTTSHFSSIGEGEQVSDGEGMLRINKGGQLTLDDGNNLQVFKQDSTGAFMSDNAIGNLPGEISTLVNSIEREPLSPKQRSCLIRFLKYTQGRVAAYYETTNSSARMGIAGSLDDKFRKFKGEFSTRQLAVVKKEIYAILNSSYFNPSNPGIEADESKDTWSYLQGLKSIAFEQGDTYCTEIRKLLGIRSASASSDFMYQFRTNQVGVDIKLIEGVGVAFGQIYISQKKPKQTKEEKYHLATSSFSAGLGAGIAATWKTSGMTDLPSAVEWFPEDFIGAMFSTGVSGSAAGGLGMSVGASTTMFMGKEGRKEPLIGDGMDIDIVLGLSAGVSYEFTTGYVAKDLAVAKRELKKQFPQTVAAKDQASVNAHFEVDKSTLTPIGLAAIRGMCAEHLALFRSGKGDLQIDGYTSTTGSDDHNEKLSNDRANKTRTAMRNILGDDLNFSNSDIKVKGHGETAAKSAGEQDDKENADWRKITISANGKVLLRLQG